MGKTVLPELRALAEALAAAVGVPADSIVYLDSWPVPGMPEVSWPGHRVRVCPPNGYWDAVTLRRSYSIAELLEQGD